MRASIVITGTEVLGGWIADRNGPWLARELYSLGVEHVSTITIGDRPEDIATALVSAEAMGSDLIITSGGLGPTEDDMTTKIVSEFVGKELVFDDELEARTWAKLEALILRRWGHLDLKQVREANRKQALIPAGAEVIDPVGTAPGLVVSKDGAETIVVVLPGPPAELVPMWNSAKQSALLTSELGKLVSLSQTTLRLYGVPESDLVDAFADFRTQQIEVDDLEVTTCAHAGELEVVIQSKAEQSDLLDRFVDAMRGRYGHGLFSEDGRTVEQIVVDRLRESKLRVACAESCTGGKVTSRLIDVPGASAAVLGSVVSYADSVKVGSLGVSTDLLAAHGAVSEEVCAQMAKGVESELAADVSVAITGIAGPDGGTAEKPVGTVYIAVSLGGQIVYNTVVEHFGDRNTIRDRATTSALHGLLRGLQTVTG